ncbi:ABC transporter ATP-binding protein [Nocardioides sp.]|uniref:ABC transporter ATP-binding protein n=1 Tax=Nocardioides sp. TaxID=35761 RepID=UPI003528EB50
MTPATTVEHAGELRLEDVGLDYDGVPVVRDVSLTVPAGGVLAVLGPSGSGKSTLLRGIAGLEPLTEGRVLLDGRDLAGVPTHRRGCALMFQDGQLFAHLTVAQNVGYPLKVRRAPADEVRRRVAELLDLVGLSSYDDRLPATLSGGERQRVALARALAADPKALLLDEPLSALDATLRARLAEDLRGILSDAGTTTVLVTHEQEEAFAVADTMAVMRAGRVVQHGSVAEVWRAPVDAETALFLGYASVLTGDAAGSVLAAAGLATGGDVAVRRSALRAGGEGPLSGVVVAARSAAEQLRLLVDVTGVGRIEAVAPLGSHLGPGDVVRLAVDATRLATLAPS